MNRMMYLDRKSNEIENILKGTKDVIIRAANIKKYPFKMIHQNDRIYLLLNDTKDIVYASATIKNAYFYEISSKDDMFSLLKTYQERALLSDKKLDYIRKRKYISVFVLDDIKKEYARIDHSLAHKVEDWVVVNDIVK